MTEAEQRRKDSPLLSDRGVTNIKDTVVSKIAGMAAGEVEGVHMGGSASRSAGGLLGGITGSESNTRGVSVEIGSVEAAIDLKLGIDYGKNLLGTVGEVRQKITERVQEITGLKVTELNVTIADIIFPEDGEGRETSSAAARSGIETRTTPSRELRPGAAEGEPTEGEPTEVETTEVEPEGRTHTEGSSGPVPEEEVRAEDTPVGEDETRRLGVGDEESSGTETARDGEAGTAASETGDTSDAEAPTDETTLTGGTPSGERAARETAASEGATGETDDRTQEIDRVSEAEERRAARRRRREERRDES